MSRPIVVSAAAVAALALSCSAATIELQPGVKLQCAGQVIDDAKTLGHFVPTVADWNGDGKKDLIIGSFTGDPGNVRLYSNVGTDANPKFDAFTYMQAGGVPIKLTGG